MADTPPGGAPVPPWPAPDVPAPPGGSAPRMPLRRLGWRRFLVLALVVLLIAACAVYMLFVLGSNLGPQALLIGVVAAILPVPVLVS
ncbi:PrsW family intramembrane metalloprotease, partial [Micromonospora sp. DH15]|nr:PrsW family intramembrane metalloprotease [Micromonospora sp. DH15]